MDDTYRVRVGSGTLMSTDEAAVRLPHRWTASGVTVQTEFTGAHLLHLSIAGCVLNDVHREAEAIGIAVAGVLVTASGGFDPQDWSSTGVTYTVAVDSSATSGDLARLIARVDAVAEIPRAVRSGAAVERVPG